MEIRLEVIAADMVMDSAHPVLEIQDVPMKGFEICSLSAVFNILPLVRQGAQVAFPSISGHNGRSLFGRFRNLLERRSRSIFNYCGTTPFQLRLASRHVAVIDFKGHQHEAFFFFAASPLSLFTSSQKGLINFNVFSELTSGGREKLDTK